MNFRCLRAANRGLYLGTMLLVLGACAYAGRGRGRRAGGPGWRGSALG